ncbi:MAG: lysophospholipid acyltransferase family protein, partial [Gemmatimonadales bacterium]
MIRTLWFYAVLAVSTIIHASGGIAAGLLRIRHRPRGVYDWAGTDWARDILRAAGTPVRTEGLELIPVDQPVVYAANHSSMFDIWALFATLPGSVRFVAKRELFRIPLLGAAM